ncbi:MAG: hypothetical protein AAGF28_08015 [Pseudomonadota bacterium]
MKTSARKLPCCAMKFAALGLSAALGLAVSSAIPPDEALAQTATSPAQSDQQENTVQTEQSNGAGAEQPSSETELSDTEKELDSLILGPWALITSDASASVSRAMITTAAQNCVKTLRLTNLDIEPAAERALPTAENRFGDLIYFRTNRGLQRFEIATGRMFLISDVEKTKRGNGQDQWLIAGQVFRTAVRFGDATSRGGTGKFLVDATGFYLKCPVRTTPTTDQ